MRLLQLRMVRRPTRSSDMAAVWVKEAKGSVQLAANESGDNVRLDYYKAKYDLSK